MLIAYLLFAWAGGYLLIHQGRVPEAVFCLAAGLAFLDIRTEFRELRSERAHSTPGPSQSGVETDRPEAVRDSVSAPR